MTCRVLFTSTLALLCAVLLFVAIEASAAPVVTDIRIEGNQRVDSSSVTKALSIAIGDPFSSFSITQSVRSLYRLGVFARVSIDEEASENGVALIVNVTEFPMVRRIEFIGRKSVEDIELKKVLKVKAFSFADPGKLPAEIKALEGVYSAAGYHGTGITSDIQETEKGVVITYTVKESEKFLIREVDIIGNRNIEDSKLQKVMMTKETGPLSFISSSGGYDAKAAADDLQRIQYLYMEDGFLDIKVQEPEVELHPDGEGLYVSLKVDEGSQYTLGEIRYSGDWEELPDHIRREPSVNIGDIFVRSKVMNDLRMYEDSYRDKGYAWCRIEPLFNKDQDKKEVALNLVLTKGPPVHIRWIHVSGNSKTRDYVVRREMRLMEGDLFDQKKLDDSKRFIRRMGFFSTVDVRTVKVGDNIADIHVKVEEGAAGSLSAGASFSSQSGLVGTLQLSLGNFSGRGQKLNLNLEAGSETSTYSISFTEPRLFSGPFSFGMDLFNKSNVYSEYTQDSDGASVRLGYMLSDSSSLSGRYRYVNFDVYDIDLNASDLIKEQEGVSATSSIRLGYNYDTRDFPRDPREGVTLLLSSELAGGVLGGTNDFVRYQVEGSFFTPLAGDLVGLVHLELGVVSPFGGDEVPVTERYFMGGLYTLRGFEYRKVGPLADGEPVGGTKSFLMNLEATYPLIRDANIKGVLFLDGGNVWAEDEDVKAVDLRYGAGFGFRWAAPIGLLRLEWGFNLDPKPDELQPGWEFSIGTMF
ncbi:MAG: outer membrane protein assembly factor BamA [bacterium]|nr:outer membrane protein assembly factor BamA [bacterium]MDT8365314.1 outer membrane protein assembly factor BamA [bacterium]